MLYAFLFPSAPSFPLLLSAFLVPTPILFPLLSSFVHLHLTISLLLPSLPRLSLPLSPPLSPQFIPSFPFSCFHPPEMEKREEIYMPLCLIFLIFFIYSLFPVFNPSCNLLLPWDVSVLLFPPTLLPPPLPSSPPFL